MSSKKKRRSQAAASLWSTLSWLLAGLLGSAGAAGWAKPDLPILGPLVSAVTTQLGKGVTHPGQVPLERTALPASPIGSAASGVGQGPAANASVMHTSAGPATGTPIRIASYNIQVFGESKLADASVVDVLVRCVRQFDVVAIQEVRSKSDDVLPRFLQAINADGSRYNFVIGPRLGRTNSKEQYAFVYNTNRIEIDPSSVVTLNDPDDRLHREPLLARFRVRCNPPDSGFTFWLADVHTDPDEVPQEVDALSYAFEAVQRINPGEDDVIMLGDFNASDKQLGRLGQLPGIGCVVSNITTNTRRNKTYDNLVFHGQATTEFTGRWGVCDVQQLFGLSMDQALKVSDHLPVWAEFAATESLHDKSFASRPGQVR